jgi:hypothetical protein
MIRGRADAISARTAGTVSGAASTPDRPGAFQADRTGVAGEARAGDTRTAPGAPAATPQRRCAYTYGPDNAQYGKSWQSVPPEISLGRGSISPRELQ